MIGAVLLAAALTPGAAFAARAHSFSLAFGRAGAVQGEAESLSLTPSLQQQKRAGSGVAVNATTHDVYVADTGNRRIAEFTSSGAFIRAWGWGVATGAAKLEVCTSTCRVGLSGSEPGEFESPSFVVVDNSVGPSKGDVYVGDTGDRLVTKFDAEGNLVSSWGNNGENVSKERKEPNGQLNGSPSEVFDGTSFAETIAGIAVDGSGHLWVYDSRQALFEFGQEGHWMVTCHPASGTQPQGIAVDEACTENCDLNVMGPNGQVVRIRENCALAGTGGSFVVGEEGNGEEAKGLAVDSATGDLLVDRAGERIEDIPATCQPSSHGCQPSQVFGEEVVSGGAGPPPPIAGATGVAVDPHSGAVYVANTATDQIAVFADVIEATVAAATVVTAHAGVLHGAVDPEGSELTRCRFEYGRTTAYGSSVPCEQAPASIGHGTAPVPVSAKAEGLDGGSTYHFRLSVRNANGAVESEDEQLQTAPTAVINGVAAEVTGNTAVLNATVNPEGLAAHYHFEYGVCKPASNCVSSPFETIVPVPDAEITAGTANVLESRRIEGLLAGDTYHFRIAVTDANGLATPSPEASFVVAPEPPNCATSRPGTDGLLGGCRQYEMVTPPGKDGALIDNGAFLTPPSIAPDGSRIIAKSIQCLHEPESCVGIRQTEGEPYEFRRTESGWQTTPLAPPAASGGSALTYDAETGVVLYALAAEPPAREQFYSRTPDGTFHAIGPIAEGTGQRLAPVADRPLVTTRDLSRLVYESGRSAWPSLESGNIAEAETVFEYKGTGNTIPELVGVTGPAGSTSLIGACGTNLGAIGVYGALSSDGRTVFVTVERCPHGTGTNASTPVPAAEVYARIEQAKGMSTVLVSGPGGAGECDTSCKAQPTANAAYRAASRDGSRVYFTSTQRLTNEASEDNRNSDSATGAGCAHTAFDAAGCNLYEFECPNHCENASERHLIDASAGDTSGLGPEVQGVMAVSPDGSHAYFVARGVLSGANTAGGEPVPGGLNLYVYQAAGSGSHVHFIATLTSSDAPQWTQTGIDIGIANTTPDGRYLVFTSHKALTPDATQAEGPAQVYRYDAENAALSRVSIGRDGFNADGNAAQSDAGIVTAFKGFSLGIAPGNLNPTMSNDGQFVFFESPTALAPGALNNQPVIGNKNVKAENVYEWAANGAQPSASAPRCEQPAGCVSLVSDGKDVAEGSGAHFNLSAVQLLGTDASGHDVYFWTADSLVPSDTDSQVDLYDARVDGGIPAPIVSEPCATLETCHPSPQPPPTFEPTSSGIFSGFGNAPLGTEQQHPPGARGPTSHHLTLAQQLSLALQKCRKLSKRVARVSCEGAAHHAYKAQMLALAMKACRRMHGKGRRHCERQAQAHFGVHRASRRPKGH
ncbi:MAG: hypothetical protein ACYDCQ_03020 [Dehalococcoidia bacterium]